MPPEKRPRTKDDDEEDWDMTLTTGLHPQIEEKALQPGNTPTSSISETGWKPILHCAVARHDGNEKVLFRCARIIARPSEEPI